MKSSNRIPHNADLDDSFVELFRSHHKSNSVSHNISSENNQTRNQLYVGQSQEGKSVSCTNIIENKEFFVVNENKTTSKLNEICNLLKDNVIQHCPICFKKNTSDQIHNFIAHLKGCALKHKISTEQLIKAVQLVEKQTSERIALGLPKISSEKTSVKKNYTKMGGMDSKMQLAMALSVSLRESEFSTKLKETETLIEAGLEQEAFVSCKQLEDFGFKTSKPSDVRLSKTNNRSKDRNSILFSRSQAERERIITEKVAIILVDTDEQNSDFFPPKNFSHFKLKSTFLRNIRDENYKIWKKSFQSNEETSEKSYYLENLSSFISPCKIEVGTKLKHISQIPGRISSDDSHFSRSLQELIDYFRPTTKSDSPKSTTKVSFHCPVVRKQKISRLSSDFKSLVNKKSLSDIIIYVKHERSIYAHKLIFHARCCSILDDVIKETENGKTSEIIIWMEFSYESAIAFLEYIYADATDFINKLDENQLSDLNALCIRYRVDVLKECVDELNLKEEPFALDVKQVEENFNNCSSPPVCSSSVHVNSHSSGEEETTDGTVSPRIIDGEENLRLLQMALATQNEKQSPEIFIELDTPHAEANLEDDFSLSICDSASDSYNNGTHVSRNTPTNGDSVALRKCENSSAETSLLQQSVSSAARKEETRARVQWTCDTEVICLSDDDDLANIPEDVNQITINGGKSEKRKSSSPLFTNPAKKTIFGTESCKKERQNKTHRLRKKQTRRTNSSQYSLSDSVESSDSDESLYKINVSKNVNIYVPSPGPSSAANISQGPSQKNKNEADTQQAHKLTSPDSSFELDDFRNLKAESGNISCMNRPAFGDRCNSSTSNDGLRSHAQEQVPCTSPVWYGFDGGNDDYLYVNFSPSPCKMSPVSKFSTPVKNLLTKNIVSPVSSRNVQDNSFDLDEFSGDKNGPSSRMPDVPTFESFSIDESVLSKLESKTNELKPGVQSQVATPKDVRKFKARSKSDTFLTPSPRSNGCVTPLADYSSMKTVELKRELDRYGIKPGLAKNKAKQLLRHIYDQLHPLDEEIKSKHWLEEKEKIKKKSRDKKSVCSNNPDEKSSATSVDSDESSDSFASGIEELEASFNDDVQSLDNNEETKSQKVSIDSAFKNLIQNDQELHTQILLYEPIWLDQLKMKLKEKNVKCSSSNLINYLDEKCITFRTQGQRRVPKKRKKIR